MAKLLESLVSKFFIARAVEDEAFMGGKFCGTEREVEKNALIVEKNISKMLSFICNVFTHL